MKLESIKTTDGRNEKRDRLEALRRAIQPQIVAFRDHCSRAAKHFHVRSAPSRSRPTPTTLTTPLPRISNRSLSNGCSMLKRLTDCQSGKRSATTNRRTTDDTSTKHHRSAEVAARRGFEIRPTRSNAQISGFRRRATLRRSRSAHSAALSEFVRIFFPIRSRVRGVIEK